VEKVWKRSAQIGAQEHTVIIHGKRHHEETRATFSHARESAPVMVIRDLEEAQTLASYVSGERPPDDFFRVFTDRCSPGFRPDVHLKRIGVVNQTTMLASETSAIAALLRDAVRRRVGDELLDDHFADTADTLCYATNENQDATQALIADGADLALVVGGYNSSNTSHLAELCELAMPTYFISGAEEIESPELIRHFDYPSKQAVETRGWYGKERPLEILLTAGASCPDILLDRVIRRLVEWEVDVHPLDDVLSIYDPAPAA
jgi:4-hydroxy-3-methylbut-2-enyl diphosphate reductase